MQDVNLAVQRAQDKVLSMQARANALDELTQSGTLPEIGTGDDIDRQLAQISSQSDVDQELAASKNSNAATGAGSRTGTAPAQLPATNWLGAEARRNVHIEQPSDH